LRSSTGFMQLLKPRSILELGSSGVLSRLALACGCRDNGTGLVESFESDRDRCADLNDYLHRHGCRGYAVVHDEDPEPALEQNRAKCDLVFFGALWEEQLSLYQLLLDQGRVRSAAVFYGVTRPPESAPAEYAADHRRLQARLEAMLARAPGLVSVHVPLHRGLLVVCPDGRAAWNGESGPMTDAGGPPR
jgi:predicted O-methyltransferase YrrM